MQEFFMPIIHHISFIIGLVGIMIIMIGATRGLVQYFRPGKYSYAKVRLTVGSHIILGLDFLVGKDIIDTLLLDASEDRAFLMHLAGLFTVVVIRIVLTYFTEKELESIENKSNHHLSRG
jgi:uncharacterized membrane protein